MSKSRCYWDAPEPIKLERTTLDAINGADLEPEEGRAHLGFSEIGEPDERRLWFRFRWSLPQMHEPRIKRLFRLGQVIEEEVAKLLRRAGVSIVGEQEQVSLLGGHFGGSMDGVALGVPEAPKTPHVWECKSASAKSFAELTKAGSVKKWKPVYYAQAQNYMGAHDLARCLFTVYNKDNSDLYVERIKVDKAVFSANVAKARRVISDPEPAGTIYPSANYYEAKFGELSDPFNRDVYWGKATPAPNCRNCRFAFAGLDDGTWLCTKKDHLLTIGRQRKGCREHNFLPCLVPRKVVELGDSYVAYEGPLWNVPHEDGKRYDNALTSQELHHASKLGFDLGEAAEARKLFNATLTGVTL